MIKKRLKTIIITSLITILPMLAGLIMWQFLPEKLPTHWNFEGQIDDWSRKPFVVFGLPSIMLGIHLLCAIVTSFDPKTKNFNNKVMGLVLWICPVLSIACMSMTYAASFGIKVKVELIIPLVVGIVLLIVGNYLSKCKQNYTIGIKIPWTLRDEDNWNKTHRFAGFLWTACSLVIIVGAFFKNIVVFTTFIPVAVMVIAPMIYSYIYYRKHR